MFMLWNGWIKDFKVNRCNLKILTATVAIITAFSTVNTADTSTTVRRWYIRAIRNIYCAIAVGTNDGARLRKMQTPSKKWNCEKSNISLKFYQVKKKKEREQCESDFHFMAGYTSTALAVAFRAVCCVMIS